MSDEHNREMDTWRKGHVAKYIDDSVAVQDKQETKPQRYSVQVLLDCIMLQDSKGSDYQSKKSTVKQADYYPSGCLTILEIMHSKMLRMRSIIEASLNDPKHAVKYESLEDSAKDLINYASFFASYLAGEMDGQAVERDFLNRIL